MRINPIACKITYLQVVIGRLALISNGLATNFRRFIHNSTCPFWAWTYVLLDVQQQFPLTYNTHEKYKM